MSNIKDKFLFQQIKQGDQKALEQLYKKYFPILCEFAFSYLRDFEISEEVVSDVFLNIWNKRKDIDIITSFKSYLFKSVRNKALDNKSKTMPLTEDLETYIRSEPGSYPNSELEFMEFETEINRLIESLPPKRRIIFKMNRFEGLKYKEIAEILSISVNTVQKQMTSAINFFLQHQKKIETLLK